jgi:hypothetical protein
MLVSLQTPVGDDSKRLCPLTDALLLLMAVIPN